MIAAGGLASGLMIPPLVRLGHRRLRISRPVALAAAMLVAAVPVSVLIAAFSSAAWHGAAPQRTPAEWYLQTMMAELLFVGAWVLLESGRTIRATMPVVQRPLQPVAQPLLSADPVLCLQMEDHYVRRHRADSSRLEHMTLAEAIALHGGDGVQVHRSWWVARHAIAAPSCTAATGA